MKLTIIAIISMIVSFSQTSFAWNQVPGEVVPFEEEATTRKKKKTQKKYELGSHFQATYKDIEPFEMITLDTRFNTPILMKIRIDPTMRKSELVIRDPRGNANIFDIEQKGQELVISPTKIKDYRIIVELRCNALRKLTSFGDNRIQILGLNNHVLMLVLNDGSYVKLEDGVVRNLIIQANSDSQINGLGVINRNANIFASDRALVWINSDYADLKLSKGALVKCERLPYDHRLRTQKSNTFIKEVFSGFDSGFLDPPRLPEELVKIKKIKNS